MKIYKKVFFSLAGLFILIILYSSIKIIRKNNNIEKYETFHEKFQVLDQKLDSLPRIEWSFPYPAFYINLDSDVEKNQFIQDQIQYYDCSDGVTRISAIDGRQSKPEFLDIHSMRYPIVSNLTLTNPELGCLLSHLKVIIQGYLSGHEFIIVLEDDAYFKHARLWNKTMFQIVQDAPSDWNILNLYSSTLCCKNFFDTTEYVRHTPEQRCYLTACYIMNRRGMQNILNQIQFQNGIIYLHTDNVNDYHGADEVLFKWAGNTYFVKPTTVFAYNNNEAMKTSIQNSDDLQNQLENALHVLSQY
jgi:GR25 family glycosyltransferase involved in LPS biosynthesis